MKIQRKNTFSFCPLDSRNCNKGVAIAIKCLTLSVATEGVFGVGSTVMLLLWRQHTTLRHLIRLSLTFISILFFFFYSYSLFIFLIYVPPQASEMLFKVKIISLMVADNTVRSFNEAAEIIFFYINFYLILSILENKVERKRGTFLHKFFRPNFGLFFFSELARFR